MRREYARAGVMRPDDFFIKPAAIADERWHVYNQDRSAWSFLSEQRPFGEQW